jgi:TP901 family phage tail tape measure protein
VKVGVDVTDIGKVQRLDAAIESLQKRATTTATVKVNAEGAIKEVTELGQAMANIRNKDVTVRVNTSAALDQVRVLDDAMAGLRSRTVNLGASGPGGGGLGGGLQSAGFHQMATGSIVSSAITRPIMGLGEGALEQSSAFEKQMRLVGNLTVIGAENVKRYRGEILKLASDDSLNSKGPMELANGLYVAASKVKDASTAMEALRVASHGATAGLGEIKDIEGGVSSVLNAFNMGSSQAAHLMDIFTNAVKEGGAEASEFVSAIPRVASTAAIAGVSVEEMSASIATMTRVGISAPSAATALNRMLLSIVKPSEQAKKAIDDLGTSFPQVLAKIKGEGLQAALADIFKRADGDVTKLTPILGPVNSIRAALTTQGSQPEEYRRIVESMKHVDGLTDRAAENATQGFALQLERLKSALQVAAIELGDHLAPKLAPVVKFLRDTMPEGIKTTEQAWASLDPTLKKGIAGFVGLVAMLGPMMVTMGTGKIVLSALSQTWGAFGVTISRVAQGFLGLAAAGPLGWAAIAAIAVVAVTAGVALGNLHEQILKEKEAADAAAASTAYMVKELERAATVSTSSPGAKKGIEGLSAALKDAGNNTSKLMIVLKEAVAEKVEIGKDMKLSPIGKAVAERELQQFINNLSARVITLNVDINTGKVTPNSIFPNAAAAQSAVDRLRGRSTPQTQAEDWQARARATGVQLPAPPSRQLTRTASSGMGGTYQETYTNPNFAKDQISYTSQLAQAKRDIVEAEHEQERLMSRSNAGNGSAQTQQTKAQTQATKEQTSAVETLTDAELKHERARLTQMANAGKLTSGTANFDPDALTRAEKVENETNVRKQRDADKERISKAQRDADKAAREAAAKAEALKAQARAESIADQARANRGQDLGQQLTHWNGFGNQVESILSSITQMSERAGAGALDEFDRKLAEAKTRARLLRDEFDGISQPLKESVINLAGITAELQKIVGLRDALRQTFGQIWGNAGTGDRAKVADFARDFEKSLGLEKRANELIHAAQERGAGVLGTVAGKKDALQDSIRANQLAGRRGFDDPKNPDDGNLASGGAAVSIMEGIARQFDGAQMPSACATVAGKMMNAIGIAIPQNANARGLRENAIAMGAHEIPMSQAKVGDLINWVGARYGANGSNNHVGVYEGNGLYSGNHGGRNKNPMALHEKMFDIQNAHFYNTSDFAGRGRVAPTKPGEMPASTAPRFPSPTEVSAPTATVERETSKRDISREMAPFGKYESIVKTLRSLPSGWGTPMAEYRARQGEQTGNRQAFEQLLNQLVAQGVKVPDAAAQKARLQMAALDIHDSIKVAGNDAARTLAEMGARVRLAGRENNPYLVLLEEFQHGEKRFVSEQGKGSMLKMTLATMRAGIEATTREGARQNRAGARVATENAGLLSGTGFDAGNYDRAQFQTAKRFEIWNSADITAMSQAIAKLRESGKALEAERQQKYLNAEATARLTDALSQYDAEQGQGALRLHAEEMKRLSDEAAGLDRVARLRSNPALSPRERDNIAASMDTAIAARKQLSPAFRLDTRSLSAQLTDSLTGGAPFVSNTMRQLGLDAGVGGQVGAAAYLRRGAQKGADIDANREAANSFNDRLAALREQLALTGRHRPGDSRLDVESGVARERESLLSGEFRDRVKRGPDGARVLDTALQADLKKRLDAKRQELEIERDISQLQERQSSAVQAQNGLLDLRKESELMMVRSAAERLQIEFRYQDLQRKDGGPTPDELAARNGQLEQVGKNEHLSQVKNAANDASRVLSDSIYTGMKEGAGRGARSLLETLRDTIMRRGAEQMADSLTNKLFRKQAGGNVIERKPDWMEVMMGKNKVPLSVPIAASVSGLKSQFAVAPHRSTALSNLATLATGGALGGSTGSAQSASVVHINTNDTRIDSDRTTVSGGMTSSGGSGGGSGTTPMLEHIAGGLFGGIW